MTYLVMSLEPCLVFCSSLSLTCSHRTELCLFLWGQHSHKYTLGYAVKSTNTIFVQYKVNILDLFCVIFLFTVCVSLSGFVGDKEGVGPGLGQKVIVWWRTQNEGKRKMALGRSVWEELVGRKKEGKDKGGVDGEVREVKAREGVN